MLDLNIKITNYKNLKNLENVSVFIAKGDAHQKDIMEMPTLSFFLVTCYATLQPALLVRRSIRPSFGPSVRLSHFTFFGFLRSLASLLLPK